MSLLLCCLTSCKQLLNFQPVHPTILNPIFSCCELAGAVLGVLIYLFFGFKRSLIFSIVVVLANAVGIMYIQDRDKEFHAQSEALLREEKMQFYQTM